MGPSNINEIEHIFSNVDSEDIVEFLNEKGAVEVVSIVDSTGYRLGELDDALDVSRSYINQRATEALGLDLFKEGVRDGTKVYKQAVLGEALRDYMRSAGLIRKHEELRTTRKQYLEIKSEFEEWADDSENIEGRLEEKRDALIAKQADNFDRDFH